jgi:anaerobic selenocysteine-containing dehydrogenase
VPETLGEDPDMPEREPQSLRLMTLRSDSQFNTTIYSLDDRFRGIKGDRMVIFMCEADMTRHGLQKNDRITLRTIADDGFERRVTGLRIQPYDIPQGCIAGYYPECNPLLPLWHYAKESKVPGAKSIPVLIVEVNGRPREA